MSNTKPAPEFVKFHRKWERAHEGRHTKRACNKANRRFAKMQVLGIEYKEPVPQNSICNWKGW